jgi:hypothetical protein
MKKIATLLLAVFITLILSSCAASISTTTETGTFAPSVTSSAVNESPEAVKPAEKEESPAASAEPAEIIIPPETPPVAKETPTPTVPPTSAPAEPPVTPEPTPQRTDPPATPTPPTEPPTPKTAYDAPYDTAQILADAKAYGESIGMTWSEPLTVDNCSWEAPIHTSSTLSGERLKTAIESSIRRIKKLQEDNEYQPGEFHFKVVFEPAGSEYAIYFLMG